MSTTNFSKLSLPNEGERLLVQTEPFVVLGTSALPNKIGTADVPQIDINTTSALTTGNVLTVNIIHTMTVASASTGEVLHVGLTSEVALGDWYSAILAKVDFGSTGRVAGMAAAVTGEMHLADKAAIATGGYWCFDAEIEFKTSTTIGGGTHAGFFYLAANGTGVAAFDTNGLLFELVGVSSGSTKFWYDHDGTAGGDTVGEWLKVRTPSGIRYLGLYDAQH